MSRFSEVLGAALDSTQKSGYPESQPPEQSEFEPALESTQKSGYPESQPPEQSESNQPKAQQERVKLPKRENPEYTQTTFRIPKKLSRQINRALMDLADEGVEMDRSDLLSELVGVFISLADEVGPVEALKRFNARIMIRDRSKLL